MPPRAQATSSSQARMGGFSPSTPQLLSRPQIQEHGKPAVPGSWRGTIPGFPVQPCCWPGEVALVWEPHALPASQGFESHRWAVPGQKALLTFDIFFFHLTCFKFFNSYSM